MEYLNGIHYVSPHMAKINFEPLCLSNVSFEHKKCNPYPWKPYSRHKNIDSMYHGSKVIAKNLFWLLPMSAILDFVITKMPSGCNHYTHLIRKLHGIETPKMQRKDCYQAKQGFEEILACATRLWTIHRLLISSRVWSHFICRSFNANHMENGQTVAFHKILTLLRILAKNRWYFAKTH